MEAADFETTSRVLGRHRDELLRSLQGVAAIGVGRPSSGAGYAIVVCLERREDIPSQPQPPIEGVPVRFEVTGAFRPL